MNTGNGNGLAISVIVPVSNAQDTIPALLESLRGQQLEHGRFEVILVNNNSTDAGMDAVADFVRSCPDIAISVHDCSLVQSSYAARNMGVERARGGILVFTDADCAPASDWLFNINVFFSNPENRRKILAGGVEIIVSDPANPWERYDKLFHLDHERYVKRNAVITANLAVSRDVFETVGPFLEITSGGDHEWGGRAVGKGFEICHDKDVRVRHPSRKTLAEHERKMFRIGLGKGELAALEKRSFLLLMLSYILRFIQFRTNFEISRDLAGKLSFGDIFMFNLRFNRIRWAQLRGVGAGYRRRGAC